MPLEAQQEHLPEDTHTTWLSILIPVYNVLPYLEECLNSVATQLTYGDGIEVILVDDCSTDGSRELATLLCARFGDAFRIINNPSNGGLSAVRNILIGEARGTYTWFVDFDDMLISGAIASLRAVVENFSPDIVTCDYMRNSKYRSSMGGLSNRVTNCPDDALFRLFNGRKLYTWTKVIKRALWSHDIRYPEGRCFEDIATIPYVFVRAKSFYHVSEAWYFYRLRNDSITAIASDTVNFDINKNNDLAFALSGFPAFLQRTMPNLSAKARYAIGYFVSKELLRVGRFRQSAVRVNKDIHKNLPQFGWYWQQAELCSPINFDDLTRAHLRHGKLLRWLQIKRWKQIAQRDMD